LRQRIGYFVQHQCHAQGHHEAREIAATQHEEAGEQPQQRGCRDGCDKAGQWIGGHELAEKPSGIGARPEEGGMAQRYDAGIAQDQIEREREQREDRHFVQQQVLARRQEECREGQHPEDDLGHAPTRPPRQGLRRDRLALRHRAPHHRARANRPLGLSTSTTIKTT
jgi:hypothetical protein